MVMISRGMLAFNYSALPPRLLIDISKDIGLEKYELQRERSEECDCAAYDRRWTNWGDA